MQIDDDILLGGVISAIVGFFAWILRSAAKQVLDGFQHSLDGLTKSVDTHAGEMAQFRKELADFRVELAEFRARLVAVEHDNEFR